MKAFGRWLVIAVLAVAVGELVLALTQSCAGAVTLQRDSSPSAASGADPSSMIVTYYDLRQAPSENGSGIGDNLVRLVNPTAANGSVCAFIYVFDSEEEMGECCGCPISPNGIDQLSVANDLTNNWGITSADEDSGVIDITTGLPNSAIFNESLGVSVPACDAGAASTPVGNLIGTITHNQAIDGPTTQTITVMVTPTVPTLTPFTTGLTEVALFDEGAADPTEAAFLVSTCHFLETNGSGKGLCTCGNVDPGNVLSVPTPAPPTATQTATATATPGQQGSEQGPPQ